VLCAFEGDRRDPHEHVLRYGDIVRIEPLRRQRHRRRHGETSQQAQETFTIHKGLFDE
jgi:hypothetical protein